MHSGKKEVAAGAMFAKHIYFTFESHKTIVSYFCYFCALFKIKFNFNIGVGSNLSRQFS